MTKVEIEDDSKIDATLDAVSSLSSLTDGKVVGDHSEEKEEIKVVAEADEEVKKERETDEAIEIIETEQADKFIGLS